MRIRRIVFALIIFGLAFASWHHAQIVAADDSSGQDGTCQAIEELAYDLLGVFLTAVAVWVSVTKVSLQELFTDPVRPRKVRSPYAEEAENVHLFE